MTRRYCMCRSALLEKDVAQFPGEGFGLARVSGLATDKAAVMAGEDRCLRTEQFCRGHRRATGERPHRLFTHSDHDACRRRGKRVEVRAIAADRTGAVGE